MKVRDRMTKYPVTIAVGETVRAAADIMRLQKVRHLPIVDETGALVGIVTDRDIRQVLFARTMRVGRQDKAWLLQQLPVEDIMSAPPVVTTPSADLADAARIMHDRKIGALPVVEGRRVVGILSEHDILRAFFETAGRPIEVAFEA
jgi:acetoin utilization protein AcuB